MTDNKLHATERLNNAATQCHANAVRDNLELLNAQNAKVHLAVQQAIPAIDQLVTTLISKMKTGGKLYYIGAGTSGRLGVLDASECPPTFGVPTDLVQGIMAGGMNALSGAKEGVEDDPDAGQNDVAHLTPSDVLVGLSASGSAVYVRAAIRSAKARGIYTAAICTASDAPLLNDADCAILAATDPEIPAGSTRMFSGTAQKMILNMITTTAMIGLGRVWGGYMVDMRISNRKLEQRAMTMIATLSGHSIEDAQKTVNRIRAQTDSPVKPALVMLLDNVSYDDAVKYLQQHGNRIDALMIRHGRDLR